MPRKYGVEKKEEIRQWLEMLREYLLIEFHHNGVDTLSANDVRNILIDRKFPMPPEIEGEHIKEGQAWCNVFRTPYYEKTGTQTLSNASGYVIEIYRYVQENDDRSPYARHSPAFSADPASW